MCGVLLLLLFSGVDESLANSRKNKEVKEEEEEEEEKHGAISSSLDGCARW